MDTFATLLHSAIGLDAASIGTAAIDRAVSERRRATGLTLAAYADHLRSSHAELQALIDAVVVPETWFFRDQAAFDLLARTVREQWLDNGQTLRLLSAPSSTGEEPFSMAMTLLDAGLRSPRFRIDAVDVSRAALAKAERAVYGRNSFRGSSLAWRSRFFDEDAGRYRLHQSVRQAVSFHHGNICVPQSLPNRGGYHAIFCRNVLIYFDRPTQERAIAALEQLLAPEGLLVVAPSETSVMLGRPSWLRERGTAAFRRGAAPPSRRVPVVVARRAAAVARPLRAVPASPPPPATVPADPVAAPASAATLEDAERLANQGRVGEATAICERHLQQGEPTASAYRLLGVLRDASGDTDGAIACYRKALYLDPNNADALAHLAIALDRDRRGEAVVVRARARRLAGAPGAVR